MLSACRYSFLQELPISVEDAHQVPDEYMMWEKRTQQEPLDDTSVLESKLASRRAEVVLSSQRSNID